MRPATSRNNIVADRDNGHTRGLNVSYKAALICLVAFGMNAFGLYYLFLSVAMVLLILSAPQQVGHIPVDLNMIMLVLFAMAYSLPVLNNPGQALLNFLYPVAYLVGFFVVRIGAGPSVEFRRLILTVVAGATLHGVLNAVTNVWSYRWNPGIRALPDYWTREPVTATLQATLFIPLVGFAYYGLAMRQEHRAIVAVLTGSCLIVAGAYNLVTASRTIYVVMAITLCVCALVSPRRRVSRTMMLAGTAIGVCVLYALDAFGLRSFLEGSALGGRLSSDDATGLGEDPRFERWGYVIDHFWDHMGGGLHFRASIGYVHNLWLDAYDVAGFHALLVLLGFTAGAVAILWRICVSRDIPLELKVLVVGLYVAFLAQFMTEPILDGMPMLFSVFCVICGAAAGLVHESPATKRSWRDSRIAS